MNLPEGTVLPYWTFQEKRPAIDTGDGARAGWHALARSVATRTTGLRSDSDDDLRLRHPMELTAELEEGIPLALLHDRRYAAAMPRSDGSRPRALEVARTSPLWKAILVMGLSELVTSLEGRGVTINRASGRGSIGKVESIDFDLHRLKDLGLQVQAFLQQMATMIDLEESEGWARTPQASDRLATLMTEWNATAGSGEAMDRLVTTLSAFDDDLADQPDSHLFQIPEGTVVTPGLRSELKAAPARSVQKKLDALPAVPAELDPGPRAADALTNSMIEESDVSGFTAAIERMRGHIANGVRPNVDDVHDSVLALTGAMVGVPLDRWPREAKPVIHLFRADPNHPFVRGANLTPGQSRKAHVQSLAWQVHVPEFVLEDAGRLPARLARLAADAAEDVHAMLSHMDPDDQELAAAMNMNSDLAGSIMRAIEPLRSESDGFVADPANRFSTAATLRRLTAASPERFSNAEWRWGVRDSGKAVADQFPDASGPREILDARSVAHYEADSIVMRRLAAATLQVHCDAPRAS